MPRTESEKDSIGASRIKTHPTLPLNQIPPHFFLPNCWTHFLIFLSDQSCLTRLPCGSHRRTAGNRSWRTKPRRGAPGSPRSLAAPPRSARPCAAAAPAASWTCCTWPSTRSRRSFAAARWGGTAGRSWPRRAFFSRGAAGVRADATRPRYRFIPLTAYRRRLSRPRRTIRRGRWWSWRRRCGRGFTVLGFGEVLHRGSPRPSPRNGKNEKDSEKKGKILIKKISQSHGWPPLLGPCCSFHLENLPKSLKWILFYFCRLFLLVSLGVLNLFKFWFWVNVHVREGGVINVVTVNGCINCMHELGCFVDCKILVWIVHSEIV